MAEELKPLRVLVKLVLICNPFRLEGNANDGN